MPGEHRCCYFVKRRLRAGGHNSTQLINLSGACRVNAIRVLVIDDNSRVRGALHDTLSSKSNLEVFASEAIISTVMDLVEEISPDVVVLEPKTLNGRGLETCRQILSTVPPPTVIVLTSYHSEADEMVLLGLGVRQYILKDIGVEGLYRTILDVYSERQSRVSEDDS